MFSLFAKAQLERWAGSVRGDHSERREQPGQWCPASDCLGVETSPKEESVGAFSKGLRYGPSKPAMGCSDLAT